MSVEDPRASVIEQSLSRSERIAFNALASHLGNALELGVRGLSQLSGVSTATIVRMTKKLGYRGFTDMVYQLERNPAQTSTAIATPSIQKEPFNDYPLIFNVSPALDSAISAVARRLLHTRGLVHTYGHGFSSIMAEYLTKKLARLEIPSRASNADNSLLDFENVADSKDTLALFSRSGITERVVDHARIARDADVTVISFTNDTNNPLRNLADIAIAIPDDRPLDNRNSSPSFFFASNIAVIESIVSRYYALERSFSDASGKSAPDCRAMKPFSSSS